MIRGLIKDSGTLENVCGLVKQCQERGWYANGLIELVFGNQFVINTGVWNEQIGSQYRPDAKFDAWQKYLEERRIW